MLQHLLRGFIFAHTGFFVLQRMRPWVKDLDSSLQNLVSLVSPWLVLLMVTLDPLRVGLRSLKPLRPWFDLINCWLKETVEETPTLYEGVTA